MDLMQMMMNRRSVRKYAGERIPEQTIDKILMAGLMSPSGRNAKPWEFILIRDKATLKKLSKARVGAAKMLENADAAVVVIANPEKTDVWIEDCSIAMANMHLMADSLGVGSCWIQGRLREAEDGRTTEEYICDLLSIPESYSLEAILSLGMPKQHPDAHIADEADKGKIHKEKY
ncbi:MAG: nitroreductase [Clostridia bacterium]|nr:nitroreductase family protein [Lachnospiraceae bacterium]NCB99675.1 nitroreductase [Clostridia bacterium]NCD01752.1 nitroreductase [Clostridia bacterium]